MFSRSAAASPENNYKNQHKYAPRNTPKSDKIHTRKNSDFWHRFWHDFDFKNDPQNDPKVDQNGTLGLPRAPLGPLGGARGPTRCLKTDFWLQFGTPNDPKMTPKSTKMAPLGSQRAPWYPLGEPGAHQVPQDRRLAPIWHPK